MDHTWLSGVPYTLHDFYDALKICFEGKACVLWWYNTLRYYCLTLATLHFIKRNDNIEAINDNFEVMHCQNCHKLMQTNLHHVDVYHFTLNSWFKLIYFSLIVKHIYSHNLLCPLRRRGGILFC